MHDIIKASIFAAIGVLVFASLLVPVVSDAMVDNGEPITYTNGGTNPLTMDYYDRDFTITYDDGVLTLDDYSLSRSTTDYRVMYWEYGRMVFNRTTAGNALSFTDYRLASTSNLNVACTVNYDYDEHEITVVRTSDNEVVYTFEAETVMAMKTNGNYVFIGSTGIGNSYYRLDMIDAFTLGYIDTHFDYQGDNIEVIYNKHGFELYGMPEGVNYTVTMDIVGKTLVNGTTDIYQGGTPTFTIVIDGEDEPIVESAYRFGQAVIKEVNGHQTSGALYDMLGVLPIAVICVLIFGVLGAALYSRIE